MDLTTTYNEMTKEAGLLSDLWDNAKMLNPYQGIKYVPDVIRQAWQMPGVVLSNAVNLPSILRGKKQPKITSVDKKYLDKINAWLNQRNKSAVEATDIPEVKTASMNPENIYAALGAMYKQAAGVMPENPAGGVFKSKPLPPPITAPGAQAPQPQQAAPAAPAPDPQVTAEKTKQQVLGAFKQTLSTLENLSNPQQGVQPEQTQQPQIPPPPNPVVPRPERPQLDMPLPKRASAIPYKALYGMFKQATDKKAASDQEGKGIDLATALLMAGIVTPVTATFGALQGLGGSIWDKIRGRQTNTGKNILRGATTGAGTGLGMVTADTLMSYAPESARKALFPWPTIAGGALGNFGAGAAFDYIDKKRGK